MKRLQNYTLTMITTIKIIYGKGKGHEETEDKFCVK